MLLLDHLGERERESVCVRFRIILFSDLEAVVTTYYLIIHCLKCFELYHLWDPTFMKSIMQAPCGSKTG